MCIRDSGNLGQIAGIAGAGGARLSNLDTDVSAIGDLVAQRFKPCLKAGNSHGRGSHIDATAAGAHIEGNADDTNAAGGQRLETPLRKWGSGKIDLTGHRSCFLRESKGSEFIPSRRICQDTANRCPLVLGSIHIALRVTWNWAMLVDDRQSKYPEATKRVEAAEGRI